MRVPACLLHVFMNSNSISYIRQPRSEPLLLWDNLMFYVLNFSWYSWFTKISVFENITVITIADPIWGVPNLLACVFQQLTLSIDWPLRGEIQRAISRHNMRRVPHRTTRIIISIHIIVRTRQEIHQGHSRCTGLLNRGAHTSTFCHVLSRPMLVEDDELKKVVAAVWARNHIGKSIQKINACFLSLWNRFLRVANAEPMQCAPSVWAKISWVRSSNFPCVSSIKVLFHDEPKYESKHGCDKCIELRPPTRRLRRAQ